MLNCFSNIISSIFFVIIVLSLFAGIISLVSISIAGIIMLSVPLLIIGCFYIVGMGLFDLIEKIIHTLKKK